MKLRRIEIQRLPGIDEPFALPTGEAGEDAGRRLGSGVHVIVGPNAIGKSSLCRAVAALLWREPEPLGGGAGTQHTASIHASALFEIEGVRWRAVRDGPHLRWQREGVDSPPPPLPAAHLSACFFLGLRDLLALTPTAGQDVAAAIRHQLAGGFDLAAVDQQLFGDVRPRFGYHESRQVDERRREVRDAERRHRELAGREVGVEELEGRLRQAEAARVRVGHVATARRLRGLQDELARVEAELRALPPALGHLTGREEEELATREGELADRLRQRADAVRQKEVSARDAAGAGLAGPLPAAEVQELEARVQALQRVEGDLESTRRDVAEGEGVLARARRDLGDRGEPGETGAELDPDAAGALFALLRRSERWDAQRAGVEEQLRVLEDVPAPGPEELRALAHLRRGVERLRAWLRAPEPGALGGIPGGKGAALLAAAGAVLFFAAGGGLVLLGALLAGLGVGLGTLLAMSRRWGAAGAAARQAAQREYPAELAPPSAWRSDDVARRLDELEGELARLQARAERAELREVERKRLAVRRRELATERDDLDARRAELARGLGLEALPDAELADVVERLARLRDARRAAASARAREEALATRRDALLAELAEAFGAHGAPAAPRDAAAAHAAVSALRSRSEVLTRAREREAVAAESLRRLDAEIEGLEEAVAGIYRRAGLEPGDRAGLARHVRDLERYRELRDRRRDLRALADHERRGLEDAGAAELAERSEAELEAEAARLAEQAQETDSLHREIAAVRHDVRRAREGHELEEALARHAEALDTLREKRDARLRAEAGRFLLGAIEREHEASQRPRVLERARRLFAAFTHHRYELQVAPDDDHSFVALETSTGTGLRPDQLSDGTRAQLVLAARLAFAEEAEAEVGSGVRLPIFLDEALDHSDPERFEAIARSLGRMVRGEGEAPAAAGGARGGQRQLFYLTTDPADVARLERALAAEACPPPRVIDLATARRRAASVPGREALRVDPIAAPPSPQGHDAESYGAALGVPGLQPDRGAGAQHLFHLLWDDLPLLHRLLAHRIERVGAWTHLSREEAPLGRELRKAGRAGGELDDRAELLAAFCEAWQVGRGRPVDREILERSGAVTDRFMEGVVAVARDLGGDPRLLIEALRERSDERLKGFQSQKTDQLEEFLVAEGHLDLREPLAPDEILARLLARPAAARLPEGRAAACCHRWVQLAGGASPPAG